MAEADAERLARRLERERTARADAERIAVEATRRLWEHQQELELLVEVAEAVNRSSDLDEAAEAALPKLTDRFRLVVSELWLAADDNVAVHTSAPADGLEPALSDHLEDPTGPVATIVRRARSGSRTAAGPVEQVSRHLDVLAAPILVGGEVVAVLAAVSGPGSLSVESSTVARIGDHLARAIERQLAAETLRQANAMLDVRIAQRTEELERARRAAEASSLAKSEFLDSISHDLRNPLVALAGLVDEAATTGVGHEEIVHRSGAGLRSVLDLTEAILELGSLEQAEGDGRRAVELGSLLEGALAGSGMVVPSGPGARVLVDPDRVAELLRAVALHVCGVADGEPAVEVAAGDGVITISMQADLRPDDLDAALRADPTTVLRRQARLLGCRLDADQRASSLHVDLVLPAA